jgi:hypothetical protein
MEKCRKVGVINRHHSLCMWYVFSKELLRFVFMNNKGSKKLFRPKFVNRVRKIAKAMM